MRSYFIPAHASVEIGHRLILEHLELAPLLTLNLRLGEGTKGALAMQLLDSSVAIMHGMATFDEAGVAGFCRTDRAMAEMLVRRMVGHDGGRGERNGVGSSPPPARWTS